MNPNTDTLRAGAESAAQNVDNMQTAAPTLLQQLKQNLVGIFAKDNPVIQARDAAVTNYLNTPSQTRANLLPGEMPQVEGRSLALSPTQQDAIVTGRSNAALVPAVGLNNLVTSEYGSLADIVKGAGSLYDAQITAGQNNAQNRLALYKAAVDEENSKRSAGANSFDLPSILAALREALGVGANGPQGSLDDIFGTPKAAAPTKKEQVQKIQNSPLIVPKPMTSLPNTKFNYNTGATGGNGLSIAGNGSSLFNGLDLSGLHL